MKCKKCGKEIIGEIQRYCPECKKKLEMQKMSEEKAAPQPTIPTISKKVSKKKEKQTKPPAKHSQDSKKRKLRVGRIIFTLLLLVIIFIVSYYIGCYIVPLML